MNEEQARETKVLEAIKEAGLYCRAKTGWISQGFMINPNSGGQGNVRAKATEIMTQELRKRGWDVLTFYKMD